jgi:hypothetical protein
MIDADRFLGGVHTVRHPHDHQNEQSSIDPRKETQKLSIEATTQLEDEDPEASRRVSLHGFRTRSWLKKVLYNLQLMRPGPMYRPNHSRDLFRHDINIDFLTSSAARDFPEKNPKFKFKFNTQAPTEISVRYVKDHQNEASSKHITTCVSIGMTRTISIWRSEEHFDRAFPKMLREYVERRLMTLRYMKAQIW